MSFPTPPTLKADELLLLGTLKTYPGELRHPATDPNNEAFLQRQAETESNARSYPRKFTFAMAKAKGMYIKDTDGNAYYDCLSGAGALALGHNHPVVHQAITEQLADDLPMLTLDITTPVKDAFVQEILSCLPEEFAKNAKIQFCSPSGADAVEAAIKLVKTATGRRGMMAFQGGYHGMTHGALGLMGNLGSKSKISGLMPDVQFLPFPYIYRSPMGDAGDLCSELCSNYIETLLTDDESGVTKPAGIILEAVQGEGGKIPVPAEFLQRLRKLTEEQDIPLIIDEVQTGFGRTGKLFAFEHAGIIPDVVVLSKAIGGSLPLAIVVYHKKLHVWGAGSHAGTFRGNQLAMATGMATIQYIRKNDLAGNAAKMGDLFKMLLGEIQTVHPCLGDIRGLGLMLGVEIVNPTSAQLLAGKAPRYEQLSRRIQAECFNRGLIIEIGGRQSSVLRFMPPLTITETQVRHICTIFGEAVAAAEKELLPHQN